MSCYKEMSDSNKGAHSSETCSINQTWLTHRRWHHASRAPSRNHHTHTVSVSLAFHPAPNSWGSLGVCETSKEKRGEGRQRGSKLQTQRRRWRRASGAQQRRWDRVQFVEVRGNAETYKCRTEEFSTPTPNTFLQPANINPHLTTSASIWMHQTATWPLHDQRFTDISKRTKRCIRRRETRLR